MSRLSASAASGPSSRCSFSSLASINRPTLKSPQAFADLSSGLCSTRSNIEIQETRLPCGDRRKEARPKQTTKSHALLNGPLPRHQVFKKRQQRLPIVCTLQTFNQMLKINDPPCFLDIHVPIPSLDRTPSRALITTERRRTSSRSRSLSTSAKNARALFCLIVCHQGVQFHGIQEI